MAIPMYFYIDGAIEVGGFGFMYHYLYGIGIIALGVIAMMFSCNNKYIARLIKTTFILSLSYLISLVISMIIWGFEYETKEHMITGAFMDIYVILALLVSTATVFLFKDYAVVVSCIAMGIGNGIIVVNEMMINPPEFINQLIALVVTFGEDTGIMMHHVEVHDLTFGFGLYLMYALLDKKLKGRKLVIAISLLFSITGLKRIAFIGIVLGGAVYLLLHKIPRKRLRGICIGICIVVIIFTFCWIIAVHTGILDILEEMGVDTKGRNLIFRQLNQLFTVSPFFMGRGVGWSKHAYDTLNQRHVIDDAFHNEYVRIYIEHGFMGYLMWIIANTVLRYVHLERTDGKKAGLLYIAIMLFAYSTYASDNTAMYFYTNMAIFTLALQCDAVAEIRENNKLIANN